MATYKCQHFQPTVMTMLKQEFESTYLASKWIIINHFIYCNLHFFFICLLCTAWIPMCGGYDPRYLWQTTWVAPLGVVQSTRRSLAEHDAARRASQDTGKIS